MASSKGYFALVLHAHLPYVLGHGTWPHGAEWLYEAAAETYIPLLQTFERLEREGVPFNVTLNLSPILLEQLADPRFQEGFVEYLKAKADSAEADREEFRKLGFDLRAQVAAMWADFYRENLAYFEGVGRDLIRLFRRLQEAGFLEILTSAATHGYLPLLKRDAHVRGQVQTGIRTYLRFFGRPPQGIWPPELAYRPAYHWAPSVNGEEPYPRQGLEEIYHDLGLRYFLVDQHLLKGGKAIGTYLSLFEGLRVLWERFQEEVQLEAREKSPYRPYLAISPGGVKTTAFFVRDPETALQVWSRDWGYPGDPAYLEFHKKHFPSGHRYWRVTDPKADLAAKAEYDPQMAEAPIRNQAMHFASLVHGIVTEKAGHEAPVVVSPYDAELFGHWWFEGPRWLYQVFVELSRNPAVEPITLGRYLELYPPEEVVILPEGSWGEGGFHWVWLNEWTEWTWRRIYEIEDRFLALLERGRGNGLAERLLKQAARELLILEASDWQFLITTWSARDYAEARFSEHADLARRLLDMTERFLERGTLTEAERAFLESVERLDPIFPDLELDAWRS